MQRQKQTFESRINRLLTHRNLPLAALAIGIVLGIPTLWAGWGYSDDLLQRSVLLSSTLGEALSRLYLFLDPAINPGSIDQGIFPWWTFEQARVFFFRPLSALSLWLDYRLWPDSSALMHLHSVLWYGIVCASAAILYRRISARTPAAGLAAVLFAVSASHIGCVISLAARNLLMAAFFGFLTVYFHDRWRRDGWRPGIYLGLVSLILCLLSAEMGVSTVAYLLAYSLFLERDKGPRRFLGLAPYLVVTLGWWVLYQVRGYGAWGSGFYLNPVREPLQFALALIERLPMLLMGRWVTPDPVTYAVLSSGAKFLYWAVGILVLALIGLMLSPLIRGDRAGRFYAGGMLAAVIPICAVSPPSGRHLLFISLGAFGLMGHFIAGRLFELKWAPPSRLWRNAALGMSWTLLGLHAFLYPVVGTVVRQSLDSYPIAITDLGPQAETGSQDVVVVNAPSPGMYIYLPAVRSLRRQPMPAHLRVLAPGYAQVSMTRLDEKTFVVRPESGYLLSADTIARRDYIFLPFYDPSYAFLYGDKLFRGDAYPMTLGQQVDLEGMRIEVISLTEDGRPLEARIQFMRPPEDESLVWLAWDWSDYRYVPFSLPAVGETVQVAGPF